MSSALFTGGKIWNPDGIFTEAFGVEDGHFNFSGSNFKASSLKNNYDKIIDLNGKLVLPGLTDGHLHLVYGAKMRKLMDCSLAESPADLMKIVKDYRSSVNVNEWMIGSNLDLNKVFPESKNSEKNLLDDFIPDQPLYITNYDYHSAICNSSALKASGLLKNAGQYSAGEIERSASGNLTGVVREKAMNTVIAALPIPPLSKKADDVEDCIKMLHSYGITTVSDITLPEDIEVYKELNRRGKLNLRINSYIPFSEFGNYEKHVMDTRSLNHDYFSIKGFKAFWDGALGSETALFSLNYKRSNYNGYKTEQAASGEIERLAHKIDAAGLQMIIHAIGDKAVSEVLDLYGSLANTKALRHRIEHAQHIQPADYEKFGKFGVIASVQPIHLKYDAKTVFEKLPAKIINNTHNYVHILKSGGILNFGTDFPIVDANPFANIHLAATRETKFGEFTYEHSIPLHECLKAYTYNNAYSNHNERAAGSITKGKVADFVIMHDDLFEMEPENLAKARVLETYIEGKQVYISG
jgi:predicted amidohydrolase YtcJ